MKTLLAKRVWACALDFGLIIIYALVLLKLTLLLPKITGKEFAITSPISAQIIAFFTLTLPVFLYFFLREKSGDGATIGKKIVRLKVVPVIIARGSWRIFFVRSFLKFLPWEVAHTGVQWVIYFSRINAEPPFWVYILLISPQLIIIFYGITIFASSAKSSFYDRIAGTQVVIQQQTV